jgi:hypothetical protein
VVLVAAVVGLNALAAGLTPEPEATPESPEPQNVVSDVVPKVGELTGTRAGDQVTFTWVNKAPLDGDSYIWSVVNVSGEVDPQQSAEPSAQFTAGPGTVCIDVMLRRDDGRASEPARGCVE